MACRVLSSGGGGGGGGGGGELPPQTFQLPPPKDFVNDFFLNSPNALTLSLEVKFMLLPKLESAFSYEIGTLCKIFALRVGPSHTYYKASPPPPPPKKFSRTLA